MSKFKKSLMAVMILAGTCALPMASLADVGDLTDAEGNAVSTDATKTKKGGGFYDRLREKTLKSETIFDGRILHVLRDEVLLPNGAPAVREKIAHVGAVCIVPYA